MLSSHVIQGGLKFLFPTVQARSWLSRTKLTSVTTLAKVLSQSVTKLVKKTVENRSESCFLNNYEQFLDFLVAVSK